MSDARFGDIRRAGGDRYASFLLAGYREHYQEDGPRLTPFLLQKRVRGGRGVTLYFINVWAYDNTAYDRSLGVTCQPEVQFNTRGGGPTFDVTLHARDRDVAAIEAFFAACYVAMGCEPYGDEES